MRTRVYLLCFAFLFLATQTRGQGPQAAGQSVSLETALRKTVGFVRVHYLKGTEIEEAGGTGFFVSVGDERLGEKRVFGYLVTNRHVVSPEEGGNRFRVLRTSLRLNLKEPVLGQGSEELSLPVSRDWHWHFPADGAVDLAVFPFVPDERKYDFRAVPLSMFATKDVVESQRIEEGDRVLFTGFFYQFPGLKKVRPIVREGILAMMPDEDMETTLHKPGRLYLADVHAFLGNSGAPVFVTMGGFKGGSFYLPELGGPSSFAYRLLGVLSGYYYEDANFKLSVATTLEGKVKANSGISILVPADQLKALLESPQLQALRDAEVTRQLKPKAR